ncbi:SRPBCC family protein [Thermosipho atlanticus]|uniref:Uncharacterized conserved protein YndB, AHSA1/START domain n=1 Tax=Thermosipho atlanticus DSM 15807 TaxID=1123380 RepID=A0A1M5TMW4_9BACT|nr:SRPBCC domain-containing protein [Thermosipho atlanticus]SHH52000.1 Uncharacterized conserved protein YndB, AHSA1/START domain [Thermosipho atlanticus DSM 15807]
MLELKPIVFTEYIQAPIEKVWNTFVNENGWDPWFTDGMKMELKEGGKISFRWVRLTNGEIVTDSGYTVYLVQNKLWEFWWYEYEDGFRSRATMKFQRDDNKGTWITITDHTLVKNLNELEIRYGCAYGWGQMMVYAKTYIEKGLIII